MAAFFRFLAILALLGLPRPCFAMLEGTFLYFPSHGPVSSFLQPWRIDGRQLGVASTVEHPRFIWLMCHGNAGQAANRGYVRACLPPEDSVYVLEYPGYGDREGSPSMKSINAAALEAYAALRRGFPGVPVGVIGESLGSGPASYLCSLTDPPDRAVLIVPFDNLLSVAKEHLRWLPVGLLMRDRWDNAAALSHYAGRIEIFGAASDEVIPVRHARQLAAALPRATYREMPCGHNDWSISGGVRIQP
ncbi:alpha/beta hydrolase [Opitutaceae bacterium EW11]|nr:alpha/beta hydrolase [Opitutaceae bacterium EW11]